jgi:hypothetical protein
LPLERRIVADNNVPVGEQRTATTVSSPAVSPAHTIFGRTRRCTFSAYPADVAVPPAPLPVPLLARPSPLELVPPPAWPCSAASRALRSLSSLAFACASA